MKTVDTLDRSELTNNDFLSDLTSALDDALLADGSLLLTEVDPRIEGNSWETYLISARWTSGGQQREESFAVKRQPLSGIMPSYDIPREIALLEAASSFGIRAPGVVTYRPESEMKRGFFVMEKMPGMVPMPHTVTQVLPDEAIREDLGRQIAREMALLHRGDPGSLDLSVLGEVPDGAQTGQLESQEWIDVYQDVVDIHIPVLDLACAWLAHRSDHVSGRVSLVHNDFRIGNVVVENGMLSGILDWETAHFTDPAADIAWFAQRTSRGRSSRLCRLIELEPFLDEYEKVAGWRPSDEALRWWAVMSLVKTAVGTLQAVDVYKKGDRDEMRYANMAHSGYYSIAWLTQMLRDGEWGY